jgi:nucleotide-binding universal stress UspA family protein
MEDRDLKTILLGFDGSEGAEKAATLAARMAAKFDASILVVCAFKRRRQGIEMGEKGAREIEEAHELAGQAVAELEAKGLRAEKVVLQGPAALAIVTVAEAREADLIVLGSRGRNPVADRLLGSTTEKVVRSATVPVLVSR